MTSTHSSLQGLEIGEPETVCQRDKGGDITSGGGFSNHYARPSWQDDAVADYFTQMSDSKLAPIGGFNITGRGYPDLSAAGHKYYVIVGNGGGPASSSGASTSTVAGMMSLVNVARLRGGGNSIGWINPILYSKAALFTNDVTVGKNNCTSSDVCCGEGFNATSGWDPVSGLGTLDFAKFRNYMLSMANTTLPTNEPTA